MKPLLIITLILVISCNQGRKHFYDEYFYVDSFQNLIPNEKGNVLLNGQEIHPLKVKRLHFADAGLNDFEIKTLPTELANFKNLEYLWIGMRGFEKIPDVVFTLEELKVLDLQHSKIRALQPKISRLTKLESLILLGTDISFFPEELISLKHLSFVNLGLTNLTEIPGVFLKMAQLKELYISNINDESLFSSITKHEELCGLFNGADILINSRKCQ